MHAAEAAPERSEDQVRCQHTTVERGAVRSRWQCTCKEMAAEAAPERSEDQVRCQHTTVERGAVRSRWQCTCNS
jgi:hypothetical protein